MPLVASVLAALVLVGAGLLVASVTRRAADGRLPRNVLAGLRTTATLRSDEAWRAGHAAARSASDAAGAVFALSGVGALLLRSAPAFAAVVLGGTLGVLVLSVVAARRAGRAARAAGPSTSTRDRA